VLSEKLQKAVLLGVLNEAGLTSSNQNLPAPVHVKHGQNRQGKTLHFYLNYSSSPQTVPYSYASGTNLLSQTVVTHDQSLVLQPWDAAIVQEK
jgi:beta-galactosidase